MTCVFFASAMILAGCSGDSNPGSSGGTGGTGGVTTGTGGTGGISDSGNKDESTDCTLRADLDTYVANMSKKGKNNLMSFQIVESTPAPPAKTDNVFKVKITDAGGMPVTTRLRIRVWMPEHGHDSPEIPIITFDAATSTFELNPISMRVMGGAWRVTLDVMEPKDADPADIPIDTVDFNFCIA